MKKDVDDVKKINTGLHYPISLDDLPKGWTVNHFDMFCDTIQSGFSCGQHSDENIGVEHLRPMNISASGKLDLSVVRYVQKDIDIRRLKNDDVLFNNTNSPELIGKTAWIGENGKGKAFSNHMTRIRFNDSIIPKYGAIQLHYLWSMRYFLHCCVKHVNQASISSRDLGITIPFVAAPIFEQQQIINKIEELFSELDNGIENLKKAHAQLKTYRQAVLKYAFEGKLTEGWRARQAEAGNPTEPVENLLERIKQERESHYKRQLEEWERGCKQAKAQGIKGPPKPQKPKEVTQLTGKELFEMPDLPEEWCYCYLECLGDLARGKSKHRPRNDKKLFGGQYPFIQTGEVKAANGIISNYQNTYNKVGLAQSKLWPKGTLCITIAANIANTAILGFDACFPDSIVGFTAYEPLTIIKFVDYFIQATREKIEKFAPATAQKNINLATLERLFIPYCGLKEQKAVVSEIESRLSVCDQLEQTIEDSLKKAEALRQSILKKAFAGELTKAWRQAHPELVSGENSAASLLARIKAEKAALAGSGKTTKRGGRGKAGPVREQRRLGP